MMSETAFLFSGQGSQYPGMGKDFCDNIAGAKKVFDTASEVLGFDLLKKCTDCTPEELGETRISQPAIMAVSLAAFAAVSEKGISPAAMAGHSLGEYAAMTAAGMLTAEDAFRVIKARSEAMQKAAENSSGAMYAVNTSDPALIEKICEETEGYVVPANYNSAAQIVIAGECSAADAAAEKFIELGIRCKKLKVASAFHSKLMKPAADEFYEAIKDITFRKPEIPLYSNISGALLDDFSDMPSRLAEHIISPVRFSAELNAMQAAGIMTFYELGPGKVLTGLVKKTLKDAAAMKIENMETLEKALADS